MNRKLVFCCGMSAASDDDPLVAPTPVPDARFFTFACAAAGQCVQHRHYLSLLSYAR